MLATLIVTGIAARSVFLHESKEGEDVITTPAVPVSAIHPARANLCSELEVTGDLKPYQEIEIHSLVAGYVKEINVDIGDHVKAGDVIATLEVLDIEKQLQAIKDAKRGLETPLPGTNQTGPTSRNTAQTTIVAPFDGVITKRNADKGTLVQTGIYSSTQSMPLVTLAQDDMLRASFPIPETAIGKFRVGEEIPIFIPILNRKTTGKVARFSNQVDTATRTMEVQIDIPNADFSITPGLYAIASFPLERAQDSLSLPVQAIRTPDNPSVLVISPDGVLEKRAIKVGLETPTAVQVLDGIADTDWVVQGNSSELEPGMKVTPKLASKSAASSSQ